MKSHFHVGDGVSNKSDPRCSVFYKLLLVEQSSFFMNSMCNVVKTLHLCVFVSLIVIRSNQCLDVKTNVYSLIVYSVGCSQLRLLR
jgi:hypothetical protein